VLLTIEGKGIKLKTTSTCAKAPRFTVD